MTHRDTCHHKDGGNVVKDKDGKVIANCKCICSCPKDMNDWKEELRLLLDKNIAVDGGAVATKYLYEIEEFIKSQFLPRTRIKEMVERNIANAQEHTKEDCSMLYNGCTECAEAAVLQRLLTKLDNE